MFARRAMPPVIQLDDVSRAFQTPDGRPHLVLERVSLEIGDGSFSAIVGPSGCGKTTLLNIVAGLVEPTAGVVRVHGSPLAGVNAHATYMFQQDGLLPWKTVRGNVALGLTLAGIARREADERADAWLGRVGLRAFARHYPSQLSGGMRKRVALAQNWIIDRDILLMDEPFSALDVHTRHRMETELLSLWEGGAERRTVLFVTHDLEEAIALADEVIVASAGPGSHVVARHPVGLARPRDLFELRTDAGFIDLYRAVWADLRAEVMRSQQRVEGARA